MILTEYNYTHDYKHILFLREYVNSPNLVWGIDHHYILAIYI